MKVLVACECSGRVKEAFRKRGHNAWSCDLKPSRIPDDTTHYQEDIFYAMTRQSWDIMIAHPPCTYLTVTGNKWFLPQYRERFPDREKQRDDAINFFLKLADTDIPKTCIENPIGIMSRLWRKPDQIIQPYYFNNSASKKTCLWLKGLSKLNPTVCLFPLTEWVNFKSGARMAKWYVDAAKYPSEIRSEIRSDTFPEIANAMAEQWG